MTADENYLWVTLNLPAYGYTYGQVDRISVDTGAVTPVYVQSDQTATPPYGKVAGTHDYLYIATPSGQIVRVSKFTGAYATIAGGAVGFADGPGVDAQFGSLAGIDTDGTNLYLTDPSNKRIRQISVVQPVSALPAAPLPTWPDVGVGTGESPGSGNASELCGCSQGQATSNPVNTSTGAFWHTFDDLATPGRGIALHVSRSYVSSLASQDSPFGHGWSSNYDIHLTTDTATGAVSVHQEDGSQVSFVPNGSLAFTPIKPRILASLSEDNRGTFTFIRNKKLVYKFNGSGLLTSIGDLNGNLTVLNYDGLQNLKTATDPSGRVYTFTWNGGHIVKVTDPHARSVSYIYDSGNLVSVTDPTGAVYTFTYDGAHQLLTMLNPNQQGVQNPRPLTNVYDSAGRVTQQTDFANRTTTFDYASIPSATKVTDPVGNVAVDYYSNGQRIKLTAGYGTASAASTLYTYDPNIGAIASVKDPLNHTTSFTYDARGNSLTATDALNHTTTNTYDALNDPLTTTDRKGTTTTRTFDTKGNLTSSATPLKNSGGTTIATLTTTYQHGTSSHPDDVTGIVNPNNKTTTYTYDAYGDVTAITSPPTPENAAGNKTTFTYDTTTGWRLAQVSPRGNLSGATAANFTTSYAYDNAGRATRVRDSLWNSTAPTQHQITSTYDLDGNLTSSTDKKGNLTSYTYDPDNELIKTTLPNSTLTQQTWTPNGQLKTSTDAAGHVTTNTYDALGRQATTTDPLNRTTKYSYDADSNLTLRTAPGAACTGATPTTGCTSYSYNAINQLTDINYLDGVTPAVSGIAYDADGLRTQQTDATGTEVATYDNLGRLSTYKDGAGTTLSYGYDLNGNTTSITYPGTSHTVTRTFDALDRLSTVTDWNSNTVTFGYDANRNPISSTFPTASGETDTTTYDNLDSITGITDKMGGTTLAGFSYTRDANSQVATASTTGITEPAQTYAHDALSRLTASGSATTPTTYGYSASDDILNRGTTSGGTLSTQTFNADDQLCWTTATAVTSPTCGTVPSGATTYTYDVNGNRTTSTTGSSKLTYAYNEEQHLTKYTPVSGTATTYVYDGDGLRQTKTTGSTVTRFTWDKTTSNLLHDGANYYIYDNTGAPLEQISSTGTVTWLHHDQLGTTRLLTNTSGSTVGIATYDAYGRKTATTGTVTSPLGFNGQYIDTETGLIYLRARYYDPSTAQFLTLDPLVAHTGQPYAYAGDSPLDATDPSGLWCGLRCIGGHALSADAGFADAVTFGGVEKIDEMLSPGSTCTYAHDAFFAGGEVAGVATMTYLTAGGGGAASAGRGFGEVGGLISESGNAAGGRIFTSEGKIIQRDFMGIVDSALMRGDSVDIITGAHGSLDLMLPDASMFAADLKRFGRLPGVTVHNLPSMSANAIHDVLQGPGTIIGGFCDSGACLAPFR